MNPPYPSKIDFWDQTAWTSRDDAFFFLCACVFFFCHSILESALRSPCFGWCLGALQGVSGRPRLLFGHISRQHRRSCSCSCCCCCSRDVVSCLFCNSSAESFSSFHRYCCWQTFVRNANISNGTRRPRNNVREGYSLANGFFCKARVAFRLPEKAQGTLVGYNGREVRAIVYCTHARTKYATPRAHFTLGWIFVWSNMTHAPGLFAPGLFPSDL